MKNLHEFVRKNMELAINDFGMIAAGDRVAVGLSGGADSFVLLHLLNSPKVYVPNDIFLLVVHIDLGFSDASARHLADLEVYLKTKNLPYQIEKTEIGPYAHSEANKLNPCFLCSRKRRQRLFEIANQHQCRKIALGHHKDDIIETFLINIFYGREVSTMLPKQEFFKGEFHIIRPLAYLEEKIIKKYAAEQNLPSFPNYCPTGENSKRKYVKNLLQQLEHDYRGVKKNIYKAMKNVKPEYLLPPGSILPR